MSSENDTERNSAQQYGKLGKKICPILRSFKDFPKCNEPYFHEKYATKIKYLVLPIIIFKKTEFMLKAG